jgi:hypothetical protein
VLLTHVNMAYRATDQQFVEVSRLSFESIRNRRMILALFVAAEPVDERVWVSDTRSYTKQTLYSTSITL